MRVSKAAIFTLTTVAAGNVGQQAIASPTLTPTTQSSKASSVVVPISEETPTPVQAIAPPETVAAQQFSQKPPVVQSGNSNNSAVVIKTGGQGGQGKNSSPTSPSPQPQRGPLAPTPPTASPDLVVTATDIQITGATPELQQIIRSTIKTAAGGDVSQGQLQKDVAAILDTGLFASALVNSRTTPAGLSITYQVQPIVVRSLQLSGAKALTYQVALKSFQPLVGTPISPNALKQAVQQVNKWYSENGYSLARVISIKPNREGILTMDVAEGLVGDIKFRFVNEDNQTVDSKGKPVAGRTKPDFIRQQLKLKPGEVFKEDVVRQDVMRMYALGLFESVNVALEGDASKTDIVYELKETGARSFNVGGNYNADQGILGTFDYRDQNVGGTNDTLGVNFQVGRRDFLFNSSLVSPYRTTDPNRLGYRLNAFRKRGLSETFDDQVKLANSDRVREGQIGASVSFQRPIDGWDTSLGFNYTRTSIRDAKGKITPTDEKGNQLSLSSTGIDDMATVSFTATKDQRDNVMNPTKGSVLSLSTEQSVPFGLSGVSMNRLKANYTQYVPVKLYNSKNSQVFALNVQAGTVLGDLAPYETFNLGGPNSVRGYNSGDVGSGRTYVLASAEYRFPILQALGGVLFADYASDLGSGDTVLGNPAGVRGKPGTGFGYGAGVRFDSPLGLIRADYGINDQGESQVHFGIGQRF
ncbi:MAG: BamA/TamA family outer membrane protein [Cyanomargarita calcarea GSE-NOS-MK-12-04C]|jgi:outer membrane protein insertion porin family|uniref:BamA/TamA family outer membrane protein n=1 Tax=Cyanomargarita calcarea GSE-NOS-MK-12-04C TaxID=2839659 RepID=A0A951UUF6_9CYAN|nr:BamA/TamA family outer membrane protein [Cyanomargarita calcarea GSE-NOS-MK-12-04C]